MNHITDLAKGVIVVILGGGKGTRLEPLTHLRAKPAVPVAGKYRLIDITISNAIHSGMERMFVVTQYMSTSLHRHIVRTYKFDIFSRGFVQILAAMQKGNSTSWFQGTADAVRQNLDIIRNTGGEHVLILSGDHMYRMDYRQMLADHVQHQADLTIATLPCSEAEIASFGAVKVDPDGRIAGFKEKPKTAEERAGMEADPKLLEARGVSADRPYLASMGIYIFNKQVLIDALDNDMSDFGHHVIPSLLKSKRLAAHFFDGYWRDIGSIGAFYDAHMDLMLDKPPFDFHDPSWPFYTHPRYLPGSKLCGARFHRSILAGGAQIVDSTIERAIIGIRTSMKSATVKDAYIMGAEDYPSPSPPGAPPVGIGEGTLIQRAIVDLNARIGRNVRLVNKAGVEEAQGEGWRIRDGIIVVPKNAVIPDGTVV